VLYVGRLTEVKRIPILLQSMRLLSQPDHLYLVGDGELKAKLIAMVEQLGMAAQCSFVGARPHAEIPLWFSAADCLVLCSRMEGLPTVLPEAMMSQVSITRRTGLLVPTIDHRRWEVVPVMKWSKLLAIPTSRGTVLRD
jgi:glycosyltransferase involved in cell wall biosynthesis